MRLISVVGCKSAFFSPSTTEGGWSPLGMYKIFEVLVLYFNDGGGITELINKIEPEKMW